MRHVNPYSVLVQRIQDGAYPIGARLPSERALADEFGVHRTTIQRLITRLTAEGYLDRQRGCRPVVRYGTETSSRPTLVAVLVDAVYPVVDNANGSFLLGAQSVLRAEGCRVLFLSPRINGVDRRYDTEIEELHGLLADPVDGLIVISENPDGAAPYLRELVARGTAVVTADRWVDGTDCDFVGVDNARGAVMATEHLLDLGHEKILFANTPRGYVPAEERKQAFLAVMDERGLGTEPARLLTLPLLGQTDHDARILGEWLSEHELPTGLVCVHDGVALWLDHALTALGYRVPEDISIVGFDDDADRRRLSRCELTTVRQPFFEVGRDAAEILVKRLRSQSTPRRFVRLSPSLVERTSTGPPPAEAPRPMPSAPVGAEPALT